MHSDDGRNPFSIYGLRMADSALRGVIFYPCVRRS